MPRRATRWFKDHPNLFAFILMTAVFAFCIFKFSSVIDNQNEESAKRVKAFCSLIYVFDQSIKQQGNPDLGNLQPAYDQLKKDIQATDCPHRPDLPVTDAVQSTSTTLKQ